MRNTAHGTGKLQPNQSISNLLGSYCLQNRLNNKTIIVEYWQQSLILFGCHCEGIEWQANWICQLCIGDAVRMCIVHSQRGLSAAGSTKPENTLQEAKGLTLVSSFFPGSLRCIPWRVNNCRPIRL